MGVTSARATWVSLGEGSTPLVRAPRLSEALGVELHLKCEGLNPTGSFKDRGMALAVERAAERGARAVVCASTGNTAASAAAYAARAGLEAVVLTPQGATADAKRAQAHAAGARVIEIRGSFDDALRLCRELGELEGYVLVNSVNPDRIEGQKSVVGEILEQLGEAPDVIALPYGGGGNTTAIAAGCAEAGIAPALLSGEAALRPTTFASAIRIGEPAHVELVDRLAADGRVTVVTLSEEELREAWQRLVREEGVFCEPASAAGVAALVKAGVRDKVVVAIVTGHGLKDTGAVDASSSQVTDATLDAVLEVLR
ncbi:MAG TPA: threonine synthase [Gaiellaceae bacterium]|jgi:threonine synthase|nr:threonine synthase [Gaiellaceae bacterium]